MILDNKIDKLYKYAVPCVDLISRPKKHVSLILRKNQVVSVGTNDNRTHPLAKKYGYRNDEVHSELDALLRYRGPKDGLTLVNFRFNPKKQIRMSRPCPICIGWCLAIFDDIYYTTSKGFVKMDLTDNIQ